MVNLADSILALYPSSSPRTDWRVQQDLNGVQRIVFWNTATMGAQPSAAALAAATQTQYDSALNSKKDSDLSAVIAQATNAVNTLDAYLAISGTPSNAQILAQQKAQAQMLRVLIPALVKIAARINVPNL